MLRHIEQKGGIGTYTRNLLDHLLRIDTENDYVLMYRNEELVGTYAQYPRVSEIANSAKSNLLWDQWVVPRIIKDHDIDLVFNPKLSVPIFSKCHKAFCMHGGEWFVFPQNYSLAFRAYHKLFGYFYTNSAEAIIAVSDSAGKDIAQALGKNGSKVRTIYHGVDPVFRKDQDEGTLREIKKKFNLPDRYILWVGQIYPMKNFSRLIQAYRKVRDVVDYKLVLTGQPHLKYENELALIDSLGLAQDVQFLGWVPDEDLPAIYRQATVFVFPSLYEGFGIPLIEAMASGCPVITSNCGAPAEVVGSAAVTVDPLDVDAIGDAIIEVLHDAELREDLSRRGVERAATFIWENCARNTLTMFNDVMAS
jgi:glycosyltransferase involved in cell wall biosynthesis